MVASMVASIVAPGIAPGIASHVAAGAQVDWRARPSLFQLAWHIETAAFMLNLVSVAIALFGVAGAAVRMGLAPRWYKPLSIVGLVCGVAAATQAPLVFNGTQGWQIGLIPFVAWVVLDVIVGTRMARQP